MKIPDDKVQYVERPEVVDTFIDSVGVFSLEGQITRMELCVTRMGNVKPPKQPKPKRCPVCRLVLTPDAVIDMYNQMQNILSIMEKSGVISVEKNTEKKEPVIQ